MKSRARCINDDGRVTGRAIDPTTARYVPDIFPGIFRVRRWAAWRAWRAAGLRINGKAKKKEGED
jgi:hypothetical protein